MKIGFYNHTSTVSGAEISLLLTAGHLQEAEAVLFAPEGELGERARAFELEFVPIAGYRARATGNPLLLGRHLLGMALEGWRLARLIRSHRIDIVHANSIRGGLIASLFAWKHRRPIVWHIRDMPPQGFLGKAIRRFARHSAQAVVCISEAVKAGMGDGWGGRIHVVHNGAALTPMPPEEKACCRAALHEELGVPAGAKVLTIIGQIAPWKRQEDALEATRMLLEQGCDVRLWIVGEPKFREENARYELRLRELAAEPSLKGKVVFTGFREDVREICNASDVLLLCSDNEPFGRVLIEAMSQGTPVVATNSGGVPEIVRHGECGLLYRVGDRAALAGHIRCLLSDDTARARMGRQARERAAAAFGIERTVGRLERIYRDLKPQAPLRVAIVHDYLNQMGGAERVVVALHRMFPQAPIYTTIADPSVLPQPLREADIRTTWMQRIPGILRRFKAFFWLYPLAVRSMNLRGYDLVVSSSSAYAKGIRTSRRAVHVCYCHTPMRFAWDFEGYMSHYEIPAVLKRISRPLTGWLRRWDVRTSRRVDLFVANSSIVRERIRRYYQRSASLVYPPVQFDRFRPPMPSMPPSASAQASSPPAPLLSVLKDGTAEGYFLVVSRLIAYKRIDLAVLACTLSGKRLVVVGDGPDRARLQKLAGPSVRFAGRLPDEEVERLMRGCEALLFPGAEDFGITPLEANACGKPVIAYREGGALDTVRPGVNGLFFEQPDPNSLAAALTRFTEQDWDADAIRSHAETFREERFSAELQAAIESALQAKGVARLIHSKEVTL